MKVVRALFFLCVDCNISVTIKHLTGSSNVFATNSPFCPVVTMCAYLVFWSTTSGPLFVFDNKTI